MAKAKSVSGTAKKSGSKKSTVKKATVKKAASPKPSPRASAKSKSPAPEKAPEGNEPSIAEAQTHVVASKFVGAKAPAKKKAAPRPTLPASYGESHLLLLVRDPQTLFAAWDMAPSRVEALKARIGSRALAVSTLTLRLTRAGGATTVFHVGKRARSRYLKVDGGPSFIAEIGFTPPSGRFELIARSAPCFVPLGPMARQELVGTERRSLLGYRAARALARRGLTPTPPGGTARARSSQSKDGVSASSVAPAAPRVLGGASDLYRR